MPQPIPLFDVPLKHESAPDRDTVRNRVVSGRYFKGINHTNFAIVPRTISQLKELTLRLKGPFTGHSAPNDEAPVS